MVGHSDPRRLGLFRELVSCCCFQSWKKKSSAGGCSRVNQWRHHHQSFVPARHFVSVLFLLQGISLCAAPKQRNRPKVTAASSTHDTTLVSVCHAFPFWRHSLLLRLLFFSIYFNSPFDSWIKCMIITRRNDDDDDHRHHSSAQIAAGGCGFTCWPR